MQNPQQNLDQNQQQIQDDDADFQPNANPRNLNNDDEKIKDQKFFKAMKRVVESNIKQEVWDKYPDYKEEDISSEDSKSKNEKKDVSELAKSKDKYDQFQGDEAEGKFIDADESVHKKFIKLFSGNVLQNNHIRYICLFIIIGGIIVSIVFYQVLCLYKDACFKKNDDEIEEVLSNSIFPIYMIVALFFIFLYITIDYLHKPLMVVAIVLQIISTVLCIIFCVFGFVKYKKSTGKKKTILAALFYLIIAVVQIVVLFISVYFKIMLSETANEWRPQLKTRINDIRAKRIIQIKEKYMKDMKFLYNAENKKEVKEEKEAEVKDQTHIEGNNNSISNQPRPDSGYGYERVLNNGDNNNINNNDNNMINNEQQNQLPRIVENKDENQEGSENKSNEGGKLKRRRKK